MSSTWRRQIATLAREHGAVVERTGGNHLRIRHPDGWSVYTALSPSDHRSLKNVERDIRREKARGPRHGAPAHRSQRR